MIRRIYPTCRPLPVTKLHGATTILVLSLSMAPLRAIAAPEVLQEVDVPVAVLAAGYSTLVASGTPGYRLISVTQFEADVQLQVVDAAGRRWTFDAPARRAGPERACLFDDGRGLAITLLAAAKPGPNRPPLRMRVTAVRGTARIARGGEIEAECLESGAAVVAGSGAQPTPAQRSRDFQRAAGIWQARGNASRAAFAYLQAGWMLAANTSDHVAALSLGQSARRGFAAARDPIGEALAVLLMTIPRTELLNAGLSADGSKAASRAPLSDALQADLQTAVAAFDADRLDYFAGMARIQLGASYFYRDDLDSAIRVLGEAAKRYQAAGSPDGAARALANRSFMTYQRGNYQEAAEQFDEVLDSGAVRDFPRPLADILDNSATTQSAVGNYDKALSQFVEALSLHETVGDGTGMARSLNGLASTYLSLGNARAAVDYTERARNLLETRDAGGTWAAEPTRLTSLLISGDAQRELGDLAAAEVAHRRVLDLAETARSASGAARARIELARDAIGRGDGRPALALLDDITLADGPAWTATRRQVQLRRAQALLTLADPEQAIAELKPLRGQFAGMGSPELELELLEALARAQWKTGNVPLALRTSDAAIAQLKALRLASGNPESRALLNDVYRSTYGLRVELLYAESARNPAAQRRVQSRIFAAADEARAGLVRAGQARAPADPKDDRRARMASEISLRQSVLSGLEANEAAPARATALRAELASLRARFDAAAPALDAPLPVFDASDYTVDGLRADSAVLMYLASADKLRRYLITRGRIEELPAREIEAVRSATEQALARLVSPGASEGAQASTLRSLSALLMPSAGQLRSARELIIVGDNETARVPFAALGLGADPAPVIRGHDITLVLTLRDALKIARQREQRVDLARVAVFSDPVFTSTDDRVLLKKKAAQGLWFRLRLPDTANEASAIREILPGRVLSFSGFDANRGNLLSNDVREATVLHLATHAIANDRWPNGSGLLLSALDRNGDVINGYVSTLDLLSRRASTDLVVLSACETARGESGASESVAGLARAVLGGGARRVVATHWAVDDAVTAAMMREFYRRLAAGDGAGRALSAAQRSISGAARNGRATSRLRDPASWAAFVVYERAPGE